MSATFLCPLPQRGIIKISGADRRTFLQGLISNDIALCQPGQAIYAALLTPQGKFLHDMLISDDGQAFWIDCEAARADDLLKRLRLYKLRADVSFENCVDGYRVWATSAAPPEISATAYADPRGSLLGFRLITDAKENLAATPFEVYDRHRLSLTIPDGSRDMIVGKSTLLESNFDRLNGISWSKGCYLGQELTARMHYRALVKKRLCMVRLAIPAQPPQTPVYFNGEVAGELRSSCGDLGLALLPVDRAEKDQLVLDAENFRL